MSANALHTCPGGPVIAHAVSRSIGPLVRTAPRA
jgi:hypothetical protein